jgi:ElaB/YqjD/DUF883 family membrane-anchored ribosome-binding protein
MVARKSARAAAVDHIGDDLQRLRADIVRLAEDVGSSLTETGDDALSEVKTQIQRIKDRMDAVISDVGEKGWEATEAMRDVTHDFAETVEKSVRARPLTALALAIGVGVLFGVILRRWRWKKWLAAPNEASVVRSALLSLAAIVAAGADTTGGAKVMSIKRILAPLPGAIDHAGEVEMALSAAKALTAHVEALFISEPPPPPRAGIEGYATRSTRVAATSWARGNVSRSMRTSSRPSSSRAHDRDRQFRAKDEIDQRYLDRPYYIAPAEDKVAEEAFAVIREAMKDKNFVWPPKCWPLGDIGGRILGGTKRLRANWTRRL